jgi:hypothetical protein
VTYFIGRAPRSVYLPEWLSCRAPFKGCGELKIAVISAVLSGRWWAQREIKCDLTPAGKLPVSPPSEKMGRNRRDRLIRLTFMPFNNNVPVSFAPTAFNEAVSNFRGMNSRDGLFSKPPEALAIEEQGRTITRLEQLFAGHAAEYIFPPEFSRAPEFAINLPASQIDRVCQFINTQSGIRSPSAWMKGTGKVYLSFDGTEIGLANLSRVRDKLLFVLSEERMNDSLGIHSFDEAVKNATGRAYSDISRSR